MCNNNNGEKHSFWSFLNEYSTEIPILQRDYAQGRKGKEALRKTFLARLKEALENDKKLTLDFIYGSGNDENENNKKIVYPLDGQQRLTTLWLLHWYIAYKAGTLNDKIADEQNNDKADEQSENTVKNRLKKFTYETRISSREFCEKLTTFAEPQPDDVGIVEHIKNQTWFYSAWQQDPTIQSMLCMLGGTKINDKYGEDIIDGLEELFANTEQQKFKTYWETLISEEKAPIFFYYQPLKDFGLSDDLYVKMNARGKPLTDFENIKADLIGYIKKEGWEDLLVAKDGIPIKMDTTWTDIFWDNRSEGDKIDEIYFAFLNRFFLNYKLKDIEDESNQYCSFFTKDDNIQYTTLDSYKWNDKIDKPLFDNLQTILNNYWEYKKSIEKSIEKSVIPYANKIKEFEFIPKYKKDNNEEKITSITWLQRVVFYAVCKYFNNKKEANEDTLHQWMRFVRNIVFATNIDSLDMAKAAINCIGIDEIDSHNVYKTLSSLLQNKDIWSKNKNSHFYRQLKEECEKADKILNGEKIWKEKIETAENYAFFNGSIRFLFYNEKGEVDWTHFDKKFENANKFFKKEESDGSCLKKDYDNADLLKALISRFDENNFKDVLDKSYTLNNQASSWRYYLLNPKICTHVHQLLLGETNITERNPSNVFDEKVLYLLSNTNLLDFIIKTPAMKNSRINNQLIYPRGEKNYQNYVSLRSEKRDKFFKKYNETIIIDEKHKMNDKKSLLLYGLHINFNYKFKDKKDKENEKHFRWDWNNYVYLMEDENSNNRIINDENAEEEQKKYFCFDATELNDEGIITKLNELITRYLSKENESHESNHR